MQNISYTPYTPYESLLSLILNKGVKKEDRTGTGTLSIFAHQMRFDLKEGFPLITTKKLHTQSIIHELLWLLSGNTNIQYLKDNGVSIWNEWADSNGDLGPVYGHQWRNFNGEGIDQIKQVIDSIKNNPDSRRHIVSAWNPAQIDSMALPPCHILFQFYVLNHTLSCQLYQRSADVFLGVPFNIASYALLTHLIAHQCDLNVGEFIWTGGDCHVYLNHLEQATLQLSRVPYSYPTLNIKRKPNSIFEYTYEDIEIINYQYHPAIKAAVSV